LVFTNTYINGLNVSESILPSISEKNKFMSDKENLLKKIAHSKVPPLLELAGVKIYIQKNRLDLDIDEDATPFEKSSEKNYSLVESVDLEDDYKYLLDVNLIDFGFKLDGEESLVKQVSENSEIEYYISEINSKTNRVNFKGHVFGDIMHLSTCGDFEVKLGVLGVKRNKANKLTLYQELLIEGYVLESEKNIKMAFFTYFTAIEAYLNFTISSIKNSLFDELHHALEYLELKNKIRVVVKDRLSAKNLNKIKLWGEFQGLVGEIKKKRDAIAHGKSNEVITVADVNNCFFLAVVLISIGESGNTEFVNIIKQLYPSNN